MQVIIAKTWWWLLYQTTLHYFRQQNNATGETGVHDQEICLPSSSKPAKQQAYHSYTARCCMSKRLLFFIHIIFAYQKNLYCEMMKNHVTPNNCHWPFAEIQHQTRCWRCTVCINCTVKQWRHKTPDSCTDNIKHDSSYIKEYLLNTKHRFPVLHTPWHSLLLPSSINQRDWAIACCCMLAFFDRPATSAKLIKTDALRNLLHPSLTFCLFCQQVLLLQPF